MENTNPEYQTILDAGKITDILEPNRGFYDTNSLLSLCVTVLWDFFLAKAPIGKNMILIILEKKITNAK
jgi:hypothetical protein